MHAGVYIILTGIGRHELAEALASAMMFVRRAMETANENEVPATYRPAWLASLDVEKAIALCLSETCNEVHEAANSNRAFR